MFVAALFHLLDVVLVVAVVVAVIADDMPVAHAVAAFGNGAGARRTACRSPPIIASRCAALLETTPLPNRTCQCRCQPATAAGRSCPSTDQPTTAHASPHKTHCVQGGVQRVKPVRAEGALLPGSGKATGNGGREVGARRTAPRWKASGKPTSEGGGQGKERTLSSGNAVSRRAGGNYAAMEEARPAGEKQGAGQTRIRSASRWAA